MIESKSNEAILLAYEKGYRVLDNGRVLSPTKIIRRTRIDKHGYKMFNIRYDGERYDVYVHRLMAFQKFGGIIFEEGIQVRHLNNIKIDNSKNNISFGTPKDNASDINSAIRMHMAYHAASFQRKLTFGQVKELRALRKEGWTIAKLAEKYNISNTTVRDAIAYRTYKDVL
jgi:hypothetical protein